jgi:type 1 glutamine amidotransferase
MKGRATTVRAVRTTVLAALALAAVMLSTGIALAERDQNSQGSSAPGHENLGNFNYGVCRGPDVRCYHSWGNFNPANGFRALLFTHTAGPRHADLGPPLGPGLDPPLTPANMVQNAMIRLARENGFGLDWTEDTAQLATPAQLLKYNAVVFFSPTRAALDDPAQTSLRQYIRAGGGFVGIHNAFGTEYNWPWYEGLLGNANFYDHGPLQTGVVHVVDGRDASTAGLPATWTFTDEWYNLIPFPTNVRFLATVDERSLPAGPRGNLGDPGLGDLHPVAWCQYYDGGRAWVTTLGHDAQDFSDGTTFAGAPFFQKLIVGGIESAMGMKPFCR